VSHMSAVERSMDATWKRGLSRRRWSDMAAEVGNSLRDAHMRGRGIYMPEGEPKADMQAYFDKAREMTMRAMLEVEPKYQAVSARHGDEMTAILYLLFFDEDDANMRPIARGVPAAISRRAARFDIPIAQARTALEVVSQDADARQLVRTIPRRSVVVAQDEVRRALNLGVAEAGLTAGISASPAENPRALPEGRRFPLWEIREVMDRRTRGNPHGDYPDDGYHWQVSGYISTMEEIVRQGCVPPCGRNCRAGLHPVSPARAQSLGLVNADGSIDWGALRAYNGDRQGYIDRGQYPDPRFR